MPLWSDIRPCSQCGQTWTWRSETCVKCLPCLSDYMILCHRCGTWHFRRHACTKCLSEWIGVIESFALQAECLRRTRSDIIDLQSRSHQDEPEPFLAHPPPTRGYLIESWRLEFPDTPSPWDDREPFRIPQDESSPSQSQVTFYTGAESPSPRVRSEPGEVSPIFADASSD